MGGLPTTIGANLPEARVAVCQLELLASSAAYCRLTTIMDVRPEAAKHRGVLLDGRRPIWSPCS